MYKYQKFQRLLCGTLAVGFTVSCNVGSNVSSRRSQPLGEDGERFAVVTPRDGTSPDTNQQGATPNAGLARKANTADVELLVRAGLEAAPAAEAVNADPQRFQAAMDEVVKEIYHRQSDNPAALSKENADKLAVLIPQYLQSLRDQDSAKTADALNQISELVQPQPAATGLSLAAETGVVSKSAVPQAIVNSVVSFTGKLIEFGAALYGIKVQNVDRLLASGINLLNALLAGGPEAQVAMIDAAKTVVSTLFSFFTSSAAPVPQPAPVPVPQPAPVPVPQPAPVPVPQPAPVPVPQPAPVPTVAAITYTNTIKPYFDRACTSCHGFKRPNLVGYTNAKAGAKASLDSMNAGRMPTSGRASQKDIDNLAAWIRAGMPQ